MRSNEICSKFKIGWTGKANQAVKLKLAAKIGDKRNQRVFDLEGKIISLKNNLIPSIKNCNKPQIPTTFGPLRRWTSAIIFLSNKENAATGIKIKIIVNKLSTLKKRKLIKKKKNSLR